VPIPRLAIAAIYVAGLVFAEGLRLPQRLRRARSSEAWRQPAGRRGLGETFVLAAVLGGIWILPAVYIFTHWLSALDYALPGWAAWLAIVVFVFGLLVRWRAQVDLGRAWSSTVELGDRHRLVTKGIYARIRHPLYASLILWGAAQPVLLQNLIAGWAGPLAVALIWLVRVPAEEKMMLERFGEEYLRYMKKTGSAIPRPK
jgi:protein-S-isoprenylcysteine O-methyltransferase Ste14